MRSLQPPVTTMRQTGITCPHLPARLPRSLWPMGGRLNLAESDSLVVPVAFSEFIRRVKNDDVRSVFSDGASLSFTVKPTSSLLAGLPDTGAAVDVTFSTTRPADYSIPYATMEANGVEFGAVGRRDGRFTTVMVRRIAALFVVLCLGVCNN